MKPHMAAASGNAKRYPAVGPRKGAIPAAPPEKTGKADCADREVEQYREKAALCAEYRTGEHDGECLQCDRYEAAHADCWQQRADRDKGRK